MFFSGAAYEADKQMAINSGAQDYLVKPADLAVLCREVSKLIDFFARKRELVEAPAITGSKLHESPEDNAGFELSAGV